MIVLGSELDFVGVEFADACDIITPCRRELRKRGGKGKRERKSIREGGKRGRE